MNETQSSFSAGGNTYAFHDVRAALGAEAYARLPYVARVLAENLLRHLGRPGVTRGAAARARRSRRCAGRRRAAAARAARHPSGFLRHSGADGPRRAALGGRAPRRRSGARQRHGADRIHCRPFAAGRCARLGRRRSASTSRANSSATASAIGSSNGREQAFNGLQVFPPGAGIIHQIHLEQVAAVTLVDRAQTPPVAFPDFAIARRLAHADGQCARRARPGASAASRSRPWCWASLTFCRSREFVGVRLDGALAAGITSTDIVLTLTRALRAAGVVGAFVEFFGPGVGGAHGARSRDARQHGAGIRRDHRLLAGR